MKYSLQVAPEDCTGCGLCVEFCPAKSKKEAKVKAINLKPQPPLREAEKINYDFFLNIPEVDRCSYMPASPAWSESSSSFASCSPI